MRITLFLQHYHTPDCPTAGRPYALVERLAREHDVTVITTDAWRSLRMTDHYDWAPHDARLVELPVPYDNAMTSGERLRSFAQYMIRSAGRALRQSRPDLIIGSSTPLTAAGAAGGVAALRGVPWIFEVRDLWPDFPIQMGAVPSPLARCLLYGLEHALYRSAAHVVTASPDMTRHVRTAVPDETVTTIPYGTDLALHAGITDADADRLRRDLQLPEGPFVLYAGSFGRANDLPTLLGAARRLDGQIDAPFVFAGHGHDRPLVEDAAQALSTVRLVPPQPYPRMLRLFRLASLSIVSFIDRPILATNGPSKLYDSLGAGTPVVVTTDGWTRRLVEAEGCGWFVPPSRPEHLAERIAACLQSPDALAAASERARETARSRFDRAADMDRYAALAGRIAASDRSSPRIRRG